MSEERKTIAALDLKARIEMNLEKDLEAIGTLTSLIRLSPERTDLYFFRAKLYHDQHLYDQAIADIDLFLRLPADETTSIIFIQDNQGQNETKIKTSSMLTSEALVIRSLCHKALIQLEDAENDLWHAISLDSTADKFLNLALIKLEQSDTISAEQHLLQATALDETYGLAWYNLILINSEVEVPVGVLENNTFLPMLKYRCLDAIQDANYTLAENLVNQIMSLTSDDDEALRIAGDYYYSTRDYETALYFFKIAYETNRSDTLNLRIANTYFQLQSYDAAISHYELYLASSKLSPEVWFNAAVAYHRVDDLDNACRCINEVLRYKWDHPQLEQFRRLCQ